MKALTLWQPWASLCVTRRPCDCEWDQSDDALVAQYGLPCEDDPHPMFKTIETRSWPAPKGLIGQRLAIHAAVKRPDHLSDVGEWTVHSASYVEGGPELRRLGAVVSGELAPDRHERGLAVPLPLGAVVGSAVLADCVPMLHHDHWGGRPALVFDVPHRPGLWLLGGDEPIDVTDQLPFGHFAPGRWAWLLTDAAPTTERCPACWGDGYFDAIACPTDYGTGVEYDATLCRVCGDGAERGAGHCDPIPATGRQGVWNWEPAT